METILDSIDRVLDAPTASDDVKVRDCESSVLFSGQQLVRSVEALEHKRAQEAAARSSGTRQLRPAAPSNAARTVTAPRCDFLIDNESLTRKRTTRWHHLDKCFKWQALLEYVRREHPELVEDAALMAELRELLRTKRLDKLVKYDHCEGVLTHVQHPRLVSRSA